MKEELEQWRVFVAIELPADVRKRIKEHIDRLRDANPEARASWNREENLHLTLKFLGDISVAKVEALSDAAQHAANKVSPFKLIVGGCGSFPPRSQPRVLWIGTGDPSGNLDELHRALEEECARKGFAHEKRPFHPHLTLARVRKPQGSRQLASLHKELGFHSEKVSVSGIGVIRSELRTEGSNHTVVSRHKLAGQ